MIDHRSTTGDRTGPGACSSCPGGAAFDAGGENLPRIRRAGQSQRTEPAGVGHTFPLDVSESEDKQYYLIEASLPGFKPEEIQITVEGDTLLIHAQKKEETKTEKGTYVRRERYEGEMSRSITLPTTIDPAKVEASYEHGLLKLIVPTPQEIRFLLQGALL